MIKGIGFALVACFIWGFIFVVPQFMSGFNSVEITLGCYVFYGLFSLIFLLKDWFQGTCHFSATTWHKALIFSLISTICYYLCVVLSIRYSTPAICALILGINPIVITFYGNFKHKECRNRSLILPSLLIVLGLVIINVPQFLGAGTVLEHSLGLIFGFLGLCSWSWYVVENSRFLKRNHQICSSDWSTLTGVATLFWVIILGVIIALFFQDLVEIEKYCRFDQNLKGFLIGCAILGIATTWLAAVLWNKASTKLPVSLLGQLAIFETLFGLLFVYTIDQRLPTPTEYLGISLLLGAVAYGIHKSSKASLQSAHYR